MEFAALLKAQRKSRRAHPRNSIKGLSDSRSASAKVFENRATMLLCGDESMLEGAEMTSKRFQTVAIWEQGAGLRLTPTMVFGYSHDA